MAKLVKFKLDDTGKETVLIEVEDVEGIEDVEEIEPCARSYGQLAAEASQTFDRALDGITPMVKTLKRRLDGLTDPADEVEVKFSVKLSGEVGAVVTKVGGEATYEITLKWTHQ